MIDHQAPALDHPHFHLAPILRPKLGTRSPQDQEKGVNSQFEFYLATLGRNVSNRVLRKLPLGG